MPKLNNCTLEGLQPEVLKFIKDFEEQHGIILTINSAFRSVESELKKGRSGLSAHCLGKAIDIACANSFLRFQILSYAWLCGCKRIGIGKNFIHLDFAKTSDGKPEYNIWLYETSTKKNN